MKKILTLLLITSLGTFADARKYTEWSAPIDSETKKITYSGEIDLKGINKETIFRRIKKFIAVKDFDRVENIKCKDKTIITTKFYEKALRYEDIQDGIVLGNGYMAVPWRKFNYLWVVYEFKLLAKEGMCKYEFTDFTTINFFSAPKAKSRSSGFGTSGYGYLFGTSSGTTSMNSTKIQQVNLEDYITGKGEKDSYNIFLRDNQDVFLTEMAATLTTLKKSLSQEF